MVPLREIAPPTLATHTVANGVCSRTNLTPQKFEGRTDFTLDTAVTTAPTGAAANIAAAQFGKKGENRFHAGCVL